MEIVITFLTSFLLSVYSERRSCGRFVKFHENKPCTVKLIYINALSRLNLQYHKRRSEFW